MIEDFFENDYCRIVDWLVSYFCFLFEFCYMFDYWDVEFDCDFDVIEDFVKNYKLGYCEFFVSVLCMMLWYVKILVCVVFGFNCDNYNDILNYYVV